MNSTASSAKGAHHRLLAPHAPGFITNPGGSDGCEEDGREANFLFVVAAIVGESVCEAKGEELPVVDAE